MNSPTLTRATDALIGDEEQMGGGKRENKERNRERASNTAILNHTITSYDLQGSYGEPIFSTPPKQVAFKGLGEEERQTNTEK